jgi:hypothetical protein
MVSRITQTRRATCAGSWSGPLFRIRRFACDSPSRGGIGGWHSEYEASSETLSDEHERELRRLIEESDFFNVRNELPDGGPIADGFTYSL